MAFGHGVSDEKVLENIRSFARDQEQPTEFALIKARYDRRDFARVADIEKKGTYEVDALISSKPGMCLALPVADCIALFIYCTDTQAITLAHLGWQATEANC